MHAAADLTSPFVECEWTALNAGFSSGGLCHLGESQGCLPSHRQAEHVRKAKLIPTDSLVPSCPAKPYSKPAWFSFPAKEATVDPRVTEGATCGNGHTFWMLGPLKYKGETDDVFEPSWFRALRLHMQHW